VIKEDIVFANRRGLGTTVDMNILADIGELIAALPEINPQLILDCEDMGDHLVIFDCIYGEDYSETFNVRLLLLHKLNETIKKLKLQHLKVDLPRPIPSFLALKLFVQNARDNQEEGVIIRDGSGSYEPGKLNSGGSVLKYKFVESATVVVHAHNQTKRSVEMVVRDEDGHWVIVGNCSIPINYAIPPVNACIEVEYLYAYEYGSLYQPVYKGERTDLTWGAAVQSQLKYKSEKGPAV
jgi:bifunctional non-homologous end joining protein LigD